MSSQGFLSIASLVMGADYKGRIEQGHVRVGTEVVTDPAL